jgi:TatD DNase family protein
MAGIHPWLAESTVKLPDFSQCDIIGETGLDYACGVDREAQKRLFREHLDAAIKTNKPVVLHVVRAVDDVLNILKKYSGLRGIVFHGFIGSLQQAEKCIERGYYLSVGPRSLRSPKVREVIAKIPQNLLFCETDAEQDKGNIEQVYSEVAELRGVGVEELIKSIEENYNRIFRND